ncbi:MAG: putative porin, partial [Verrucomicrobiae bacterium]|nr:putative porin [Verrucomicrobiae bacterium]
ADTDYPDLDATADTGTEVKAPDTADPITSEPSLFPGPPGEDDPGVGAGGAGLTTPTGNAVVNLINLLVARGVLTQGDAAGLITQAEQEAVAAAHAGENASLAAADAAMAGDDDIVVTHIPDAVRSQLRVEIKEEVLEQAEEDRWADGINGKPKWLDRFDFFGDIRTRYDGTLFPEGNDTTGSFPDFNRINRGDPFDVAGYEFSPQLNVDEERHRFRLRLRFGADINLTEGLRGGFVDKGFTAGFRFASGSDNSPVSTNQTLGGEFNKYPIWLDRAFLKWEAGELDHIFGVTAGRFDNPFFQTSEIMFDNDLGFDGFAIRGRHNLRQNMIPFINAGVFPLYNTSFDFAYNQPDKYPSIDKWLYGAQFGLNLRKNTDIDTNWAFGLFEFDNVEGKLSDPYLPFTSKDQSNTDHTRPSYAQKGNTYRPIRDIIPDPLNNYGTTNQYQYFGLASKFQVLDYQGRIDINVFEPYQISFLGQYARNVAFDGEWIDSVAVNNRGPIDANGNIGQFEGGGDAWNLGIQFGKGEMRGRGDWNAGFGYRYVESDAVLDALADSDFGLGGTNMEGFTASFGYALSPEVFINFRWMSANEIAGPPLATDLIQFDINAKF